MIIIETFERGSSAMGRHPKTLHITGGVRNVRV